MRRKSFMQQKRTLYALALAMPLLSGQAMAQSQYVTRTPGQIFNQNLVWDGSITTLDISQDNAQGDSLVDLFDALQVTVAGQGNATVSRTVVTDASAASKVVELISTPNDTVTLLDSAYGTMGKVVASTAAPGAWVLTRAANGTSGGGSAVISNLRVDWSSGQVLADLSGTRAAVGATPEQVFGQQSNQVLWTFSTNQVESTTATPVWKKIPREYLVEGYQGVDYWGAYTTQVTSVNNLQITSTGRSFLSASLGGTDLNSWLNFSNSLVGWGQLSVANTVISRMPEPSTYVFMGVGLLGVAWVARRKHDQSRARPV